MTSAPRTKPKPRPWQQGDDEPVSFGTWLRRQREMRQIDLADIAGATKISRRYLEAFEQDSFDSLPAPIFAKGFLREYAKFIGVDPDEAVTHYLSALQSLSPDDEEPPAKSGGGLSHSAGHRGNWIYSVSVVLFVALALLAVYFFSFRAATRQRERQADERSASATASRGGAPDSQRSAETAPEEVLREGAVPPESGAAPTELGGQATRPQADGASTTSLPALSSTASAPADSPIVVTLDFTRNCWVEIQVDNRRRIEELRVEGESVQISAQQLVEMKLGDAGAVQVHVNGYPFSLDRGSGQVARARIDLATVEALSGVS